MKLGKTSMNNRNNFNECPTSFDLLYESVQFRILFYGFPNLLS